MEIIIGMETKAITLTTNEKILIKMTIENLEEIETTIEIIGIIETIEIIETTRKERNK